MNDKVHTLEEVRSGGAMAVQKDREIAMAQEFLSPFSSMLAFTAAKQMAQVLTTSQLVPKRFQGPDALGDCVIALGMAARMGADPVMVMQNLYVVHGQPAWSGQFVIACINQSGQFQGPLQFVEVGTKGQDDWGYYAKATSKAGDEIKGPTITIGLAKGEGWVAKNTKWLNMPEMMLRYRAGSWFGRTECPELLMGFQTRQEIVDAIDIDPDTGEILNDPHKRQLTPTTVTVESVIDKAVGRDKELADAAPEKEAPKQEERPAPASATKDESPQTTAPVPGATKQQASLVPEGGRDALLKSQGYYRDGERYFNVHGEVWDPQKHATAKRTQRPVVNTDGHFRVRRGFKPGLQDGQPTTPVVASDDTVQGQPVPPTVAKDPIPDNPGHPGQQAPELEDGGGWE